MLLPYVIRLRLRSFLGYYQRYVWPCNPVHTWNCLCTCMFPYVRINDDDEPANSPTLFSVYSCSYFAPTVWRELSRDKTPPTIDSFKRRAKTRMFTASSAACYIATARLSVPPTVGRCATDKMFVWLLCLRSRKQTRAQSQICINIHPDAVPPIHAESYHVATDKEPLQVPVYF